MTKIQNQEHGQLLLEILIAIAVSAVVISIAANFIFVSLRSNKAANEKNIALGIADETLSAISAASVENWRNLYDLTHGTTDYHPAQGAGTPITIGETTILSEDDGSNGDLLVAQQATLSQTATIQSLSFYVTVAAGNLRLGIYDATGPGGGPGAKKAETNSFVTTTGWNTQNVITPVSLTAGSYWLAYLPSSESLNFKLASQGEARTYDYIYAPMPATYSTSPNDCTPCNWSFYATLNAGGSSGSWAIGNTSTEIVTLNSVNYTRGFRVYYVCRDPATRNITGLTDSSGQSETGCTTSGGVADPSTQKVTVTITWPNNSLSLDKYFANRYRNRGCSQTAWVVGGETAVFSCASGGAPTMNYFDKCDVDLSNNSEIKLGGTCP